MTAPAVKSYGKKFGSGEGSQVHTSPIALVPIPPQEDVSEPAGTDPAQSFDPISLPVSPAAAPQINPVALGALLKDLGKKPTTRSRKIYPLNLQLDAETHKILSGLAGYREMPELLRKVFVELANSTQMTATHLRNASQAVADLRLPVAKGGQGPGPKMTINVDGVIKNAVDVLARRAGIAPKGVMEAVAYIYVTLSRPQK